MRVRVPSQAVKVPGDREGPPGGRPDSPRPPGPASPYGGLCASCRHGRTIRSERGSVFVLCERAKLDPRFQRYPPQPVVVCDGFER
jgi:hypothetical protein